MRVLVLLVVCCLLAVGTDCRRHHKHGDPDKVLARKRARVEEEKRKDGEGEVEVGEDSTPQSQLGQVRLFDDPKEEEEADNLLPKHGHKGRGHKHHPVEEAADSVYKEQWKRITNYHKSDDDACSHLKCRRRQVCLMNAETGEAECVHKRVLRMRKKMKKGQGQSRRRADKKEEKEDKKHNRDHAERIRNLPDYNTRLNSMFQVQPKAAFDYVDRSASKKSEVHMGKANSALHSKPKKECTKRDLDEMGRRLLDWFKLLMEEDEREEDAGSRAMHHMTKRNSKKKELRDDDECICQAPVSWEFNQLDMDSNAQLSALELKDIEDNGYEHCVRPFIDVCDHNHDMQLSEKEWCCCFADILPPCLSAQRQIPTNDRKGHTEVLIGAFVPSCDEDGFFERQQCHGSTGQCWCVDRNGHEIHATRTHEPLDCDMFTERYMQDNI